MAYQRKRIDFINVNDTLNIAVGRLDRHDQMHVYGAASVLARVWQLCMATQHTQVYNEHTNKPALIACVAKAWQMLTVSQDRQC